LRSIFKLRSLIGVIAVALVFSLTILTPNSSAYAASSTAKVTHVEVSTNGEVVLKEENFTYPSGEDFQNYMSYFDGYRLSGINSSSITFGGIERVVAKVKWSKVEVTEEQKTEEIPYETKEIEDPTLDKGEKVIEQAGVAGEKSVTYRVTYIGGIEVGRSIVSEVVTVEPVDEVIRVGTKVTEVKEEQKTEEIPYEIKEIEDPTIDKGEKVIGQAGVAGEKTITYEVTYVNGEEVDREVVSEVVTVEPVDEIIRVGTKVTEVKEEQKTEEIPYGTKEIEDPTLDYGEKIVDQAGVAGEKEVTYKVTYVNGEEVAREKVSEDVTVQPVDEIIKVGTKIVEISGNYEVVRSVNVRSGPGASHDRVGRLTKSTLISVNGKIGNWYRFNHNGKDHYVSGSYLKQSTVAAASGNYEVTGGVNIRTGAGSSHDRVGRLTKGTIITVNGKEGNWYRFNHNGKNHYVSASYLKQTTLAPASGNYEVTGGVNIRSGAGSSYDRVGRLTKGTQSL